jgi:intergrase/recombinase
LTLLTVRDNFAGFGFCGFELKNWCGCRDLNPGLQAWKAIKEPPAGSFHLQQPAIQPFSLNWRDYEEDFLKWLESKNYCKAYFESILSNLERHLGIVSGPLDVVKAFAGLTNGQQHCLNRAVKAFLNFLELMGYSEDWLDSLRRAVPKDEIGADLRIPSEEEVAVSLRQAMKANQAKYKAVYSLVLDSGLRLTEAVRLVNNLDSASIERCNDFYVAAIGYFRRNKLAYYGFFTEYTMKLLRSLEEDEFKDLTDKGCTTYFRSSENVTPCKYLRKYSFDKMVELEVPESVADFIQGRTPRSIGARHYMILLRQAKKFYPKYAEHLMSLRMKAPLKGGDFGENQLNVKTR